MFHRKIPYLCIIFLAVALVVPVEGWSATKKKNTGKKTKTRPIASRQLTVPTTIRAERYSDLVIDAQTGRILHETNSTAVRHPASLTKMMTLYIAFQALEAGALRLDTQLPVSALAAAQPPSKLGLRAGQTISTYDAIMGLVTESANDASIVLAEALGGSASQFAELMNKQARALGMNQTVFINPNGLPDPDQITTARDMAALGYGLVYHYPGYYPYFTTTSFRYAGRVHNNHNHLMKRYQGMDGIKTGYINASGFNLVSSVLRGNTRLIGIVFGGTSAVSRDNKMAQLLDAAFDRGPVTGNDSVPLPSKIAAIFGTSSRTRQASPKGPATPTKDHSYAAQQEAESSIGTTGSWGVQVGAFSEVGAAQESLARLGQNIGSLLKDAEPSLQKLTMSDGTIIYRARYVGVDQPTARAICSYMVRHGQGCMVVSGL